MVQSADDSNFKQFIDAGDKVVIKFFANWCGTCRLFSPKFKKMSDKEEFAGITFLDINAEESPEARKLAGVNNLPFFAIFRKGELLASEMTSKEETVENLVKRLLD